MDQAMAIFLGKWSYWYHCRCYVYVSFFFLGLISFSIEFEPIFFFVKVMIELFTLVFLFISHVFFHANPILFSFDVFFVGLENNVGKMTFMLFCDLYILICLLIRHILGTENVFLLCKIDMNFLGLCWWMRIHGLDDVIGCSSGLYIWVFDLTFLFSWFFELWFHVRISFVKWSAAQRRLWSQFQEVLFLLVRISSFNGFWRKSWLMMSWLSGIEW